MWLVSKANKKPVLLKDIRQIKVVYRWSTKQCLLSWSDYYLKEEYYFTRGSKAAKSSPLFCHFLLNFAIFVILRHFLLYFATPSSSRLCDGTDVRVLYILICTSSTHRWILVWPYFKSLRLFSSPDNPPICVSQSLGHQCNDQRTWWATCILKSIYWKHVIYSSFFW